MGGTNCDDDARLADRQSADPVSHCDTLDSPALANLLGDLGHLCFGHLLVGFVFEKARSSSTQGVIAYDSVKDTDRTIAGMLDASDDFLGDNWPISHLEATLDVSHHRFSPPATGEIGR